MASRAPTKVVGVSWPASLAHCAQLRDGACMGVTRLAALAAAFASIAAPEVLAPFTIDAGLKTFLRRFEAGLNDFINGDATLWKENASKLEDAAIMGAWGAYEKGWGEAGPRYDWAAARFISSGAQVQIEYLAAGASGDLAYTIAIERSNALIVDQRERAPMALRVTHLFRKENGEWKLLHRHADPLIHKTASGTVLQRPGQW
jgi:ketosteroid isomerase-like protein